MNYGGIWRIYVDFDVVRKLYKIKDGKKFKTSKKKSSKG